MAAQCVTGRHSVAGNTRLPPFPRRHICQHDSRALGGDTFPAVGLFPSHAGAGRQMSARTWQTEEIGPLHDAAQLPTTAALTHGGRLIARAAPMSRNDDESLRHPPRTSASSAGGIGHGVRSEAAYNIPNREAPAMSQVACGFHAIRRRHPPVWVNRHLFAAPPATPQRPLTTGPP